MITDTSKMKRERANSKAKSFTGFFVGLHRRSKRGKDNDKVNQNATNGIKDGKDTQKQTTSLVNGQYAVQSCHCDKNHKELPPMTTNCEENRTLDNPSKDHTVSPTKTSKKDCSETPNTIDSTLTDKTKQHASSDFSRVENKKNEKVIKTNLLDSNDALKKHELSSFKKDESLELLTASTSKITVDPFKATKNQNNKPSSKISNKTSPLTNGSSCNSEFSKLKNGVVKTRRRKSEDATDKPFRPIKLINQNSKTVVLNTFQSFDSSPQVTKTVNRIKSQDQVLSSSNESLFNQELNVALLEKSFPKLQALNQKFCNHKLTKLKSLNTFKLRDTNTDIVLKSKKQNSEPIETREEIVSSGSNNRDNLSSPELSKPFLNEQSCNQEHEIKDNLTGDEKNSVETIQNGTQHSQYSLDKLDVTITLGTGTFGRVFLAEQRDGNAVYAMKIMKMKDIIKLNQVEHVNSERNVLQHTDHPFIVKSYWSFRDEKCLYMLLEYVPGGELFTYLRNRRKFAASDALFYVAEIISVLEYLHGKSIVYRDLKPENLLLNRDGHLKFTDFGFSKILHDITWTLCGTPEYLSPEAIQGKGHDVTCDWWALGILTYELLVGEAPFVDSHPFGLYEKILACEISWPSHLKDTEQKNFIEKLVVVDRSKRLGKGPNGTEDVKNHAWLRYINWHDVYNKKLKPPIKPKVAFKGDTSNFDDFDENWEMRHVPEVTEAEKDKFCEWEKQN